MLACRATDDRHRSPIDSWVMLVRRESVGNRRCAILSERTTIRFSGLDKLLRRPASSLLRLVDVSIFGGAIVDGSTVGGATKYRTDFCLWGFWGNESIDKQPDVVFEICLSGLVGNESMDKLETKDEQIPFFAKSFRADVWRAGFNGDSSMGKQ